MSGVETTTIKTSGIVSTDAISQLLHNVNERRLVVVHCTCDHTGEGVFIRIWPTTYLFCNDSDHRSRLLHAENITFFPQWTYLTAGEKFRFLLIFEPLPDDCTSFDMKEVIPQEGGFVQLGLERNESDIYSITI